MEAVIKAQLISAVLKVTKKNGLTHKVLANRSGLSRGVIRGILSGSLQKITVTQVLKLIEAAQLVAEVPVRKVD